MEDRGPDSEDFDSLTTSSSHSGTGDTGGQLTEGNRADTGIPVPATTPAVQRPAYGGYAIAKSLHFTAATYTALIGLILLAAGLILYIYYYERTIDRMMNPQRDFDELTSLYEIAKASLYSRMFGYIAVVLALVLIVQGVIVRQRSGSGHGLGVWLSLSSLKYLLIIALVLAAVSTVSYVYLAEVDWNMSEDEAVYMWISRFVIYMPLIAWIIASIGLVLVANRMSNLPPAFRAPPG